MKVFPLRSFTGFFATKEGFIIKPENGKDYKVPIFFKEGVKKPFVRIIYKDYELLYLLMDAFLIGYLPTDKVKYRVKEAGNIPVNSIIVKNFSPLVKIEGKDKRLSLYGCKTKAASANNRCEGMITEYQVYESLKVTDFKCFYCGITLSHNNWHLDHYIPISKHGKNLFTNIVPSCPTCNLMKSNMLPDIFVKMCEKVVTNSLEMKIRSSKLIA